MLAVVRSISSLTRSRDHGVEHSPAQVVWIGSWRKGGALFVHAIQQRIQFFGVRGPQDVAIRGFIPAVGAR